MRIRIRRPGRRSARARRVSERKRRLFLALVFLSAAGLGRGIVFVETGDPLHNTSAPAGELAGSGWALQGRWGDFLGTPVSPKYFITAWHVDGKVGDDFELRGVKYRATAVYRSPDSDLSLWRICGVFREFAELQTGTNEPGGRVVAFGRGATRGVVVTSEGLAGVQTNGWRWGTTGYLQRWGENEVTEIVDGNEWMLTTRIGDLLRLEFDATGGPNECTLSVGDSGGGVFLRDGGSWRLAGVNFSVDGPYRLTADGAEFSAALFDQGGLYTTRDETNWVYLEDTLEDRPGAFYATRIASNLGWIRAILEQPLPDAERTVLEGAADPAGVYQEDPDAHVDERTRIVTTVRPAQTRFYRLRACLPVRIASVRVRGEILELGYE